MNIFVLDIDPRRCAQAHVDRHCGKLIVEAAQMLSHIVHINGPRIAGQSSPLIYKQFKTHGKHPCTLWTGRSLSNWLWLCELCEELNIENKFRYGKDHKSIHVVRSLPEPKIEDIGLTEFAQAMPDRFKVPGDGVTAYRNYYWGAKEYLFKWKKRGPPDWLIPHHRLMTTPSNLISTLLV